MENKKRKAKAWKTRTANKYIENRNGTRKNEQPERPQKGWKTRKERLKTGN